MIPLHQRCLYGFVY